MTRRGLLAALGGLVVGGRLPAAPAPIEVAAVAETLPTTVALSVDGHAILASLKKIKRANGGNLGLA